MEKVNIIRIDTPIGQMIAIADSDGIIALDFFDSRNMEKYEDPLSEESTNKNLEDLKIQLDEYFCGKRHEFSIKLKPKGTEFQKRVWSELLKISFGKTISYRDQAISMGNLKGIRAIASANGKNKIAIIIPCHRVIGSDGSLTGYAGGLWRKKWLLNHESSLSYINFDFYNSLSPNSN